MMAHFHSSLRTVLRGAARPKQSRPLSRKSGRTRQLVNDGLLADAAAHYLTYPVQPLSYGTVRDFCDSFDRLQPLATSSGDLKDLQRPWALKALISELGQRRGRLLEIGAGEPIVADLLRRLGHEVWIVDPYDGSGNGPREFERFRSKYGGLHFVRDQFTDETVGLEPASFDCIYSISVLEHVPHTELARVMAGIRLFLKPNGTSLHVVDHVHRGRDDTKHMTGLRLMTGFLGLPQQELDRMLAVMADDTDTYYLSAESHNRWRAGVPYDEFPMRVCVSIQFYCPASGMVVEREALR